MPFARITKASRNGGIDAVVFDPDPSVGIGWYLDEEHEPRLVMHGGGDDGFLTYLVLVPSRKTGVVVMTNCDFAPRSEIWQQILAIVLEQGSA